MLTRLIAGLTVALTIASGMGALTQTSAAPIGGGPIVSAPLDCVTQHAAYTVQIVQGFSIFSPKRLVVNGTCFAWGASIVVVDTQTGQQVTAGQQFVPADANERINYTIPTATCPHILIVFVRDLATNQQINGVQKVTAPCQSPPPVFAA